MSRTKIEWTEATWNPVVGCTKIAAGCKNCYAERMAKRLYWMGMAELSRFPEYMKFEEGWKNGHIELCHHRLNEPRKWKKPRKIFVCSMSDLFHEKVPWDFIVKVLVRTVLTPQHTYQILTKRVEKMQQFFDRLYYTDEGNEALADAIETIDEDFDNLGWDVPLKNVHLGVSCSTQTEADEKIPVLLQIPAERHFVSFEPLLEDIEVLKYLWVRQKCVGEKSCGFTGASYEFNNPKREEASKCPQCGKSHTYLVTDSIDWVIIGCESGPERRPCKIEWVRNIVRHCRLANIKVFVKQLSINGKVSHDINKFPKDLRIREQ